MKYIAGMPLKYHPAVDLDEKVYDKYLALDGPLVSFCPGVPKFREKPIDDTNYEGGADEDDVRYYSFSSDMQNYIDYVKALIKFAIPQGINGYASVMRVINILNEIDPTQTGFTFRCSRVTPSNEDISNSFGESQIMSTIKGISQSGQEVNFLSGKDNNVEGSLSDVASNFASSIFSGVGDIAGVFSNTLGNVSSEVSNVLGSAIKGNNLMYPNLWRDSSFSKSFTFNFEFIAPYGDIDSINYHVILPLLMLMSLAAPRQVGANSYTSPFLVHCELPGVFVTDMGVITSLSWKKGGNENAFSANGMPLSMSVSATVKDLYPIFMLSKSHDKFKKFNIGTAQYLRNMCGVELYNFRDNIDFDFVTKTIDKILNIPMEARGALGARIADGNFALTKYISGIFSQ